MHTAKMKFSKTSLRASFISTIYLTIICACNAKNTSSNLTSRSNSIPESIQGLWLQDIARDFASDFNNTSNEELGISFIQQMYGKFKYTNVLQDADKKLVKISNQLESRLNETFLLLNHTRSIIEAYYNLNKVLFLPSAVSLCKREEIDLEEFEVTNMFVNPISTYTEQSINLSQVLQRQVAFSKILKGVIKHAYFLSHQDIVGDSSMDMGNCPEPNDSLLWTSYMSRIKYKPRNVMLLLDHGGSLSKHQFSIVKAIAKQVITVLNENDKIGVLGVSQDVSKPFITQQCIPPNLSRLQQSEDSNTLVSPTEHNKKLLLKFVDSLVKGNGSTNHSMGFQQAFQAINVSNVPKNETIMLLYVSRGLLSSLTDAKLVLEVILNQMDEAEHDIVINTCAVIDDLRQVILETHFLRDIAEQNYQKFNIDFDDVVHKGIMLPVNSTGSVGLAVARFFNTLLVNPVVYSTSYDLTLPRWDEQSKSLIVTATIPCGRHGEIGVLGVDLYFANLAEDITYYSNYVHYSYAFLTDPTGIVIVHPTYQRPMIVKVQPNFANVSRLEMGLENFVAHKDSMVKTSFSNVKKTYIRKGILDCYIVWIVVKEYKNKPAPKRPFKVTWYESATSSQLVHHRLDIIPASRMCKHFNQLATLDAGSLYLSASCFQSPTMFLQSTTSTSFSPLSVQKCMAFLKDNTRFLSNPGLREEIRDDVATLVHVLEYLRTQHLQGAKGRYIVRRYVTSPSGVMQTFPGGVLAPGFEPTKRSWHVCASEHRFTTILTPPYLDAGGAGYIVTVAYATEYVVVAMDVTFGYVFKLILEHMPFCTEKKIKCFMMDDSGYLIYHPNLIDPNGHGPIEQQHIIHKEPQVANDILYHGHFVKKNLCINYADGTIQRYYKLNTSIDEVITNAVNGEHNAKYQVSPIEGTNVFIGFVNVSEESVTTFCPCSMINRLCLNCNRMEQKECECPCECPLTSDTCQQQGNKTKSILCPAMPEQTFSMPSDLIKNFKQHNDEIKSCLPIACEKLETYELCLGVLGCEWCQVDVDAETLLTTPFCTSIQTCFNGILGSPTPYGDMSDRSLDGVDLLGNGYSPIGPVIGSALAVCLILIFSFICYRSYTSPTVDRFYLTSAQENQVRMSDLNISDDYHDLDNHQNKLLQDSKKPEPISPYCVSTGYRRPPTAADSDHGYSTMTPHDESEHLSFAPHEIDSLEDETSDGASINTSVSTKRHHRLIDRNRGKKLLTDITTLPNRNRIIAPVTVHRNMEFAQ